MKEIDKKACLDFLEPLCAPNSDSGLFLLPKLRYIVRSAVKIAGHRRLLILCLYARGDTAGNKPKLAYTMFQSGESFITYPDELYRCSVTVENEGDTLKTVSNVKTSDCNILVEFLGNFAFENPETLMAKNCDGPCRLVFTTSAA